MCVAKDELEFPDSKKKIENTGEFLEHANPIYILFIVLFMLQFVCFLLLSFTKCEIQVVHGF